MAEPFSKSEEQIFEAEKRRRRRAIAEAMQAQSLTPIEQKPPGVKTHFLEPVAKLAQAYAGGREQERVDVEQKSELQRQREMIAEAMTGFQRETTPRPESSEQIVDEQALGGEGATGTVTAPAFAPGPQAQQAAAMKMIGQIGDPRQTAQMMAAQAMKPDEYRDLGGSIAVIRNGVKIAEIPKTVSPDTTAREGGSDRRHASASGSAVLGADTTMRGQNLTYDTAALGRGVTLRGQDIGDARAAAGQGITTRGQDLSAAVSREGHRVTERGQDLTDTRASATAGRGTDSERVAAGYGARMMAAEEILGGIGSAAQKPGVKESAAGAVPLVGNVIANQLRGADRQRALQAQMDWVRAKLRKESGAVIGVDEMRDELRTYFPQIGDGPDVIAQKTDARMRAAEGMGVAAGRAAYTPSEPAARRRTDTAAPVRGVIVPRAGEVRQGYRFRGGNPADPSSWERV